MGGARIGDKIACRLPHMTVTASLDRYATVVAAAGPDSPSWASRGLGRTPVLEAVRLGMVRRDPCDAVAFPLRQAHWSRDRWLAEMISTDTQVMHGQAVIAGMSAEEITAEYPTVTVPGLRAAATYGAALAREELLPLPESRRHTTLDENPDVLVYVGELGGCSRGT
jgi:uncharacterized protein (DUF433 family)